MKNLSIKFINAKPKIIAGTMSYCGEIRIGKFKEKFDAPVDSWTVENYQKQWEEGLKRLTYKNRSCLITTVTNLKEDLFIDWWLLYKENGKIYIHNQRFYDQKLRAKVRGKSFTPDTCYKFLPRGPRRHGIKNGKRVCSEWVINLC